MDVGFHFSWYISSSRITGSYVNPCLAFRRTARLLHRAAAPFYVPTNNRKVLISPFLVTVCLLDYSHPGECELAPHCNSDLYFPSG